MVTTRDFISKVKASLSSSEKIIDSNQNNINFFEYYIPLAYYFLEVENNKEKARKYLNLFQSKKINILQFAILQREYYTRIVDQLQ